MTEELEQKALDYANSLTMPRDNANYIYRNIKNAYIAGSIENGIQWHNLRKDPNDLPPQSSLYWDVSERVLGSYKIAKNQYITNILRYCYAENCWKLAEGTLNENIIAWCEIPQFKE